MKEMRFVRCVPMSGGFLRVMDALSGTPGQATACSEMCQEYLLETERAWYRIRPKKGRSLVPVGDEVGVRIRKDALIVIFPDDEVEVEFHVVGMQMRNENEAMPKEMRPQPECEPQPPVMMMPGWR